MDNQTAYQKFEKVSKIITAILLLAGLAALVSFLIAMTMEDNLIPVLVSAGLLVIWFVLLCAVASRLNSRRLAFSEEAADPSGLFRKIKKACEKLPDSKVVFAETHNGVLEMEIHRHGHEFHITIDHDGLYMVMDEESGTPIEKEIPLSDPDAVFAAIRNFVKGVELS